MAIILSFIILILSIIAHEVAHGYAADALGDPTARLAGRLSLNPLPHLDPIGSVAIPALLVLSGSPIFFGWAKPVPYNPYNLRNKRFSETLVALAGSGTNLLLALIFGLFIRFAAPILSPGALSIAVTITLVNLFLGLFNLIPFPPLDGFTALRSGLPWSMSAGLARLEARMGQMGALSLILFLILFSYLFAGIFFKLVVFLFGLLTGSGI